MPKRAGRRPGPALTRTYIQPTSSGKKFQVRVINPRTGRDSKQTVGTIGEAIRIAREKASHP